MKKGNEASSDQERSNSATAASMAKKLGVSPLAAGPSGCDVEENMERSTVAVQTPNDDRNDRYVMGHQEARSCQRASKVTKASSRRASPDQALLGDAMMNPSRHQGINE
jgi:hypothetical protein